MMSGVPLGVMPTVKIVVDGARQEIFYRERGRGAPLLFLHGGWGYRVYPFDAAIAALADAFRILIPDRSGYGRSPRRHGLRPGFHRDAAREMLACLDALGVERAVWWGHSDGAVAAALAGLEAPERCSALILESIHYDRRKPASRAFFERMAESPDGFGRRTSALLREDHGDRWPDVLREEGRAWLAILDGADDPAGDLYGGRLGELRVPALLLHGERDPRTEPGELEAVAARIRGAELSVIRGAGHSPHSEPGHDRRAVAAAREFLLGRTPG